MKAWREAEFMLCATLVAGLAILWRLSAAAGSPLALAERDLAASADDLGNFLFEAHDKEYVYFALPFAFSRFTVPARHAEPFFQRALLAVALAGVAAWNLQLLAAGRVANFAPVLALQAASYALMLQVWPGKAVALVGACFCGAAVAAVLKYACWFLAYRAALGIATGMIFRRLSQRVLPALVSVASAMGLAVGPVAMPSVMTSLIRYLLPVDEISGAYWTVSEFVGVEELEFASIKMLLVAVNVQVPLGYASIAYLRYAQERQNSLLTVGSGEGALSAWGYARHVRWWVLVVCLPYVMQRVVMVSVLSHTFGRFRHWTERSLRLHSLFPDSGLEGTTLGAVAASNFTVEAYADAINGAVEVSYEIVSAKLLALPKLMLVPGVLAAKPWLLFAVLPASMAFDIGKARVTAELTARGEMLHRELMELASKRRRMELHDMRHEQLIQRGHAAPYAQGRWRHVGDRIEDRGMRLKAIQALRGFIDTVYSQQLLGPGVECALAFLMEVGYITTSDIWLYTSVVEQAIDVLLTRHREQATLASMQTKVDLVNDLAAHLRRARSRLRPRCELGGFAASFRSLEYARGQARVRIPNLSLPAGRVYAVTGANGCGKSTALAILASCGGHGASLPAGAELLDESASILLPSHDIVEIAQQFYCPLFATPMSWLLHQGSWDAALVGSQRELEAKAARLLREFGLLHIEGGAAESLEHGGSGLTAAELHMEREDWYSELSGGEKCKVEFIRKVFMRQRCPDVLLIDEALAPLDPVSKQAVQAKLKEFCSGSLVLVVYHGGESQRCLPSEGFFDERLHFANGTAALIGVC